MIKRSTENGQRKTLRLSVVLATKNEQENIGRCLESVKSIADEMVVYDEHSTDRTVEIAKSYGAKVYDYDRKTNFHETKQKAIEKASGKWILQMDADEAITPDLANEIKKVVGMTDSEVSDYSKQVLFSNKLFERHQKLIEQRDDVLGKPTGEIAAFFIPRRNMFLGKPLIHAGVYPDPAIRLIKKGKAKLPAKSVHEIMEVDGEVGWLKNPMDHYDSPTMSRYFWRMNRYTDLQAQDLKSKNVPKNAWYFFLYTVHRPLYTFLNLFFRHKGFLDGPRGFLWSFFSALHFPLAYYKYWIATKN